MDGEKNKSNTKLDKSRRAFIKNVLSTKKSKLDVNLCKKFVNIM